MSAQKGEDALEVRYEDETIWLTQKLMAGLFDVSVKTIQRASWQHILQQ